MKRRSNVQSKIKNKIRIKKDEARPVLDIRGLVVHRDGTLILDRLDWRVERGQHWVILGANGSGKTSLLSALTGQAFAQHSKLTIAVPSFPGIFRP